MRYFALTLQLGPVVTNTQQTDSIHLSFHFTLVMSASKSPASRNAMLIYHGCLAV